jgi:hypothetical protein
VTILQKAVSIATSSTSPSGRLHVKVIDLLLRRLTGTLLPELYEVFGEKLVEFIAIFGGKKIEVPSIQTIEDAVRDADIFNALSGATKQDSLEIYQRLQEKYFFNALGEVAERYAVVRKELNLTGKKCVICGEPVKSRRKLTCRRPECRQIYGKWFRVPHAK